MHDNNGNFANNDFCRKTRAPRTTGNDRFSRHRFVGKTILEDELTKKDCFQKKRNLFKPKI